MAWIPPGGGILLARSSKLSVSLFRGGTVITGVLSASTSPGDGQKYFSGPTTPFQFGPERGLQQKGLSVIGPLVALTARSPAFPSQFCLLTKTLILRPNQRSLFVRRSPAVLNIATTRDIRAPPTQAVNPSCKTVGPSLRCRHRSPTRLHTAYPAWVPGRPLLWYLPDALAFERSVGLRGILATEPVRHSCPNTWAILVPSVRGPGNCAHKTRV